MFWQQLIRGFWVVLSFGIVAATVWAASITPWFLLGLVIFIEPILFLPDLTRIPEWTRIEGGQVVIRRGIFCERIWVRDIHLADVVGPRRVRLNASTVIGGLKAPDFLQELRLSDPSLSTTPTGLVRKP